jgi:hypothetical protein
MRDPKDILQKLKDGEVVVTSTGDEYITLQSVDAQGKTKGTNVRSQEYVIKVSDFLSDVGASTFEELTDTPTYAGNALKGIRVNALENALETYTATDTDNNSWGMDTVAFVSPTANPGTGAIGFANTQTSSDTSNTAFRTVDEANASGASLIFFLPGYHGNATLEDNKTYYAFHGARFFYLRDNGASNITVRFLGKAEVNGGIQMTGSDNNFEIEVDEMNCTFIVEQGGPNHVFKLRANIIDCSNQTGSGNACSITSNSIVEIESNKTLVNYWMARVRNGNTNAVFKYRCPDTTVRAGGPYGNQYKSFVNHQGSASNNNTYDIDFMNGTFESLAGVTSSFGITDSALLLYVNASQTDNSKMKFSNGRVKANAAYALLCNYRNQKGDIELDNLDISSNVNAFSFWNQAINNAGQDVNITFKDCNIESGLFCQVGNARFAKFYNTNIKVLSGAEVIRFNTSNGVTPGTAYFVNCNFDLVDPGEVLTQFTGVSAGLANCYGDQPVGATVTDLYAGYTQLTPFELPNLLQ